MIERPHAYPFLLSTAPPSQAQKRLAGKVLVFLLIAFVVAAYFSRVQPAGSEILLPAYAASVFVIEILTAALLLALFSVQNSRAVSTLSCGFLFSGLLIVPWAFTLPDVFSAFGGVANTQSTAIIAAVRRLAFPVFVILYAIGKDRNVAALTPCTGAGFLILRKVLLTATLALAVAFLAISQGDSFPRLMIDSRQSAPVWLFVPATAICLYLVGLAALWSRPGSTLDLWLMVVLCALISETLMMAYVAGGTRLNFAWWAGRLYGLLSAAIVLLVLLSESVSLHARLARSIYRERQVRNDRLATMEALSASVAHEINQPLTSIVTNASAGLRWLDNDPPRTAEAKTAFQRVVRDGHRARDVVDSIRKFFRRDHQEHIALDLNGLIQAVLQRSREENPFNCAALTAELDRALPLASGSPLQIQQVVSNLVDNAAQAMCGVADRPHVVRVTSQSLGNEILVSVEDAGTGIDPKFRERIFEPFFSTKPDGMGMGLMLCRSIIENHGGRLWATDNVPHGAIFHFTLPSAANAASSYPGRVS